MGEMQHAHGMGEAVELCLGAFAAVGAAVAVVGLGLVALGRWRPPIVLWAEGLSRSAVVPEPRARAGPAFLSLLCVSRR